MNIIIPAISITLCQQGGIGYPPIILYLDKWYAISDSPRIKVPEDLNIIFQHRWQSPYRHAPDPYFHPQGWALKKWNNAPKLTWEQVRDKVVKSL